MRITLLTQADPFFLAENIDYLIENLSPGTKIVSTVVFDASPFGKKESFLTKAKKTLKIFGPSFFIYYSFKYVVNRVTPKKNVTNVLRKHNIPIIVLDEGVNHSKSLKAIASEEPDLLISIAGNQIFRKKLIELAPKGCLNLHTALLPKYRGLMPSFWVLKNMEKETGVSVFFVDEGIDSGPILVQKSMKIDEEMSQMQLIKRSKKLGMEAILEGIAKIESGKYELIENNDSEKTYFSFPERDDVKEFYRRGKRFF
ncbi:MAG: formyltransferase family protein [Bacteroidota bacterium]